MWGAILELGVLVLKWILSDQTKRDATIKRYVEWVEKRAQKMRVPSDLSGQYDEARKRLFDRIQRLKDESNRLAKVDSSNSGSGN